MSPVLYEYQIISMHSYRAVSIAQAGFDVLGLAALQLHQILACVADDAACQFFLLIVVNADGVAATKWAVNLDDTGGE